MSDAALELKSALGDRIDASPVVLPGDGVDRPAIVPVSDTVLDLDRWSRRRGRDIAQEWKDAEAGDIDPLVAADAHAALFEPKPEVAQRPADAKRAVWWRQLMETPDYRSLHSTCCLDHGLAGIAAKCIADQWLDYVANQPESEPGGGEPGGDDEPIGTTLGRIASTGEALRQARDAADDATNAMAGLGIGDGAAFDAKKLAAYFRLAVNNATLRGIMAMAGRMIRLYRSLQKTKTHAVRGEIAGVEFSGDATRLLPFELAMVAGCVPELESLALYRLAQRRCLSYRCRKNEPQAMGPVVVCVDESGSMAGDAIIAAKGLAMAMARLAQEQGRWLALVGFEAGPVGSMLVQPPNVRDQDALIAWLTHFYSGGTTLDVPLATVPNEYWPAFVAQGVSRGKTDVIVITDAKVEADYEMREKYRAWAAAETVRTYGIVIGGDEPGDLGKVCDRVWCLPELTLDCVAVQEVLSL